MLTEEELSDGDALLRAYVTKPKLDAIEQKTGTFPETFSQDTSNYRKDMVRPTGIEPVLRVPETLVISFSLRAREKCKLKNSKGRSFYYHPGGSQSTRAVAAVSSTLHHLSVNDSIRSKRLVARDGKFLAGEITDRSACFSDDQSAGGDIPRFEFYFPKAIEPAGRNIAKVERSRAGATDSLAAGQKSFEETHIKIGILATVVRKAGGEERFVQFAVRKKSGSRRR